MKRLLLAGAVFAALTTSAIAGNVILKKGDEKIRLWCNGGGCYVADYINAFKSANKQKLGKGGSGNFQKHLGSYKSKGWK